MIVWTCINQELYQFTSLPGFQSHYLRIGCQDLQIQNLMNHTNLDYSGSSQHLLSELAQKALRSLIDIINDKVFRLHYAETSKSVSLLHNCPNVTEPIVSSQSNFFSITFAVPLIASCGMCFINYVLCLAAFYLAL